MPYVTSLLGESAAANNTGDYRGYQVWVKGNGRVQVTQGPETWLFHDYIDAKYWVDQKEGQEPEPAPAPVLSSLEPNTAVLNTPDVTMHCIGSGFTEESVINFAGQPEPIVFVSDTEITTIITLSLPWGAVTVPVYVENADGQTSETLDFTFTEEVAGGTRKAPARKAVKP